MARRKWTREWWDKHGENHVLVVSSAVLFELDRGHRLHRADALTLAQTLPVLPVVDQIEEIVAAYLRHHLMPQDPLGDALHLAYASWHKCNFLLTWNCRHLANAHKFGHIRLVNALLGLHIPALVTPMEMLEVT